MPPLNENNTHTLHVHRDGRTPKGAHVEKSLKKKKKDMCSDWSNWFLRDPHKGRERSAWKGHYITTARGTGWGIVVHWVYFLRFVRNSRTVNVRPGRGNEPDIPVFGPFSGKGSAPRTPRQDNRPVQWKSRTGSVMQRLPRTLLYATRSCTDRWWLPALHCINCFNHVHNPWYVWTRARDRCRCFVFNRIS